MEYDFQMVWTSTDEEALNIVGLHMRVMRADKKKEFNELYLRLILPQEEDTWSMKPGNAWSIVKWTTLCGVMFVTMKNNCSVTSDLR